MAAERGDKRKEKSLQDILNLTIKLSEAEKKELKPTAELEPERKEFLQKAIDTVLENDEEKRLVMFTQHFLQYKAEDTYSEEQLEEISTVFEEIEYILEGLDMGITFNKLGGLKHCLKLMRSKYTSIQWRAADTIAYCVQNQPQNQFSIIEDKGIEVLLFTIKKTDVDIVRVKCLFALSSLIGGNNAADKLFVDLKGVPTAIKFLTDENPKVRLKTAFLLRKVIMSDSDIVNCIDNQVDIVFQFTDFLAMEHDESHEAIADTLLFLLNKNENSLREYQKLSQLKDIFSKRKQELESSDSEKYQELINYYTNLLSKL